VSLLWDSLSIRRFAGKVYQRNDRGETPNPIDVEPDFVTRRLPQSLDELSGAPSEVASRVEIRNDGDAIRAGFDCKMRPFD
jgi:hypothetical protein